MKVFGRGLTLVFLDPKVLDQFDEVGRLRLRSDYLKKTDEEDNEVEGEFSDDPIESVGDDSKDNEVEVYFDDSSPDAFFDLIGAMKSSDADDLHDSFLDEIGALIRKRRR